MLAAAMPKHGPRPSGKMDARMQDAGKKIFSAYELLQTAAQDVSEADETFRVGTRQDAAAQARYTEIRDEMTHMLKKVGWNKKKVDGCTPVLPISGWMGDNLIEKTKNMDWWKGMTVKAVDDSKVECFTLLDCLEKLVKPPTRDNKAIMRTPLSGVYKIKGVGDVLTGRVEQGLVKPNEEVLFLPTHSTSTACEGKVFTVEMHHKNVDATGQGDNVGMNVKGLPKDNMPRVGDVMIYKSDTTLKRTATFDVTVQVLNHPGKLKPGYCPIAFVRTGRSAVKLDAITWKMGKKTGGQKVEGPVDIEAGEMGSCTFSPQQPFVVGAFKTCEGLGRVAIMEGNSVVMLGKCSKTTDFVEK